jgi:hypothetical protein
MSKNVKKKRTKHGRETETTEQKKVKKYFAASPQPPPFFARKAGNLILLNRSFAFEKTATMLF